MGRKRKDTYVQTLFGIVISILLHIVDTEPNDSDHENDEKSDGHEVDWGTRGQRTVVDDFDRTGFDGHVDFVAVHVVEQQVADVAEHQHVWYRIV